MLFLNDECRDEQFIDGSNFQRIVCPVTASSRGKRYLWEQVHLPEVARRNGVDVMHSLGYVGPVRASSANVVTIHDTNFLQRDVRMKLTRRMALGALTFTFAHTADRIITVSRFSRAEIIRKLGVPAERVEVTYLAPRSGLDIPGQRDVAGQQVPYLLVFAGPSLHKNIPRLVEAFARISGMVPHDLHIVGLLPEGDAVHRAVEKSEIGTRVRFRGYLSNEAIAEEMQNASAFVFPSLYEGFGMPVIDAQAVGVPVICSAGGALSEVAGEGAALFDPRSVADMAEAIMLVLTDAGVRRALIRAGSENVARFSWSSTGLATLRIYNDALRMRIARSV